MAGWLGLGEDPQFPPLQALGNSPSNFYVVFQRKNVLCNREMERHSSGLPQPLLLPMRVVEMG